MELTTFTQKEIKKMGYFNSIDYIENITEESLHLAYNNKGTITILELNDVSISEDNVRLALTEKIEWTSEPGTKILTEYIQTYDQHGSINSLTKSTYENDRLTNQVEVKYDNNGKPYSYTTVTLVEHEFTPKNSARNVTNVNYIYCTYYIHSKRHEVRLKSGGTGVKKYIKLGDPKTNFDINLELDESSNPENKIYYITKDDRFEVIYVDKSICKLKKGLNLTESIDQEFKAWKRKQQIRNLLFIAISGATRLVNKLY